MAYLLAIAAFIGLILAIMHLVGSDRYSKMTGAEFEAEAQRGSALGSAVLGVQNILEPQRKMEYILQRDKKLEGESAEPSDADPKPPVP